MIPDPLTLFYSFSYGLTSSVSLCLASCLPVYLPVLLGFGKDTGYGLRMSLGFAAGRLLGYYLLGVAAALMGAAFLDFFEKTFPHISTGLVFLFGLLTVFYSLILLLKNADVLQRHGRCRMFLEKSSKYSTPVAASFSLGLISTVTPCVPVFTFLLLPFALGRVWETTFVTLAFGLGANMVFIVIGVAAGLGVKNIHMRFNSIKPKLEFASGLALLVMGLFYMLWSAGPYLFGWSNESYILPSIFDLSSLISYLAG